MKQAYLVTAIITVLIAIFKTILYMGNFSEKRLTCWLYFGRSEIMLSSTPGRRIAKEWQNTLSIVALIGLISSLCMYLLIP